MNTARDTRIAIQTALQNVKVDGAIQLEPPGETLRNIRALAKLADNAPWPPGVIVQPGETINTVIDLNHDNGFNIPKLLAAGIVAVVHKVGQGDNFKDPLYHSRRDAWKAAGGLWGGYLFNSTADPAAQARFFIQQAQFSDDELMSFDWEQVTSGGNITLAEAHTFIKTVFDLTGRYPMIYGSNVCREAVRDLPGDELLAKCSYWHVRYMSKPLGIPTNIWPTYDLWQYSDSELVPGSSGADRNKFQGTEAELRAAWPLNRRT